MGALDKQEGGSHYKDMPIQPVEFIVANSIPYREANVIKYVARHATKNGVQDINKAIHYLEMIRDDYPEQTQSESDSAQIGDDGWIEWNGGERPVPDGTKTFLKFRDGEGFCTACPQAQEWGHYDRGYDIIAYKVIK